jgi:hypothetical protein
MLPMSVHPVGVVTVPPLMAEDFCPINRRTGCPVVIPAGYGTDTEVPDAAEYAAAPATGVPKAI